MMMIEAGQPRVMSQRIVQMHRTAARHRKYLADSFLCQTIRNIIRYFLLHILYFLPFHLFSQTMNFPEA